MREVKFRWVDKYLVHLKLQEKLNLLFGLPMIMMVILATIGIHSDFNAFNNEQRHQALSEVQTLARSLSVLNQPQAIAVVQAAGDDLSFYNQNGQPFAGFSGQLSGDLTRLNQHALIENEQVLAAATVPNKGWQLALQRPLTHAGFWHTSKDYLILLIIALVVLGIITYYTSTFISGALYSQVQALTRVADGDLTYRLNFHPVRDEFSILAIAIDKLAERQHRLVKLVKDSSDSLAGSADMFGTEAINTERLAKAQRQSLDSLATAMEEMSATVKEVAHHAEDASGETQNASNESQKGAKNVRNTIDAIETLSKEIFGASDAVTKVNSNASQIDAVVTTINGISEQTNLLALNAAIEAARAGQQGRGFAVVADEVRTLAGRTQQATVEIQKMIEVLQKGTGDAIRIMDRTVQQAEHSGVLVTQAGDDLTTINRHSEQVFSMMAQIAASAEEQSAVAEDIAQNISAVRQQSLEVEKAAKENAEGTRQLTKLSDSLSDILKGLTI
ncbi:methyl-accepting chemotaxis protein [Gallaecimonas mangrovi]|uniref:methyl-accepting chemotaxis protein n=1 Tax=Gallaecimonas mangrovi TaxID=2291597 RepID=UPI000E20A838|nr:methyl-accepting chemotaxis protein [Gallaecimonas mangrovi]